MNAHELTNLHKAAQAGMAHYTCADTWHRAIVAIAKANRQSGETPEQAEARMTQQDPTVRQFDLMRREALAQADVTKAKRTGRPRKYKPQNVTVTKAESELFDLAMRRAQRDGTSFEQAFVREIDTPRGAELFAETRSND